MCLHQKPRRHHVHNSPVSSSHDPPNSARLRVRLAASALEPYLHLRRSHPHLHAQFRSAQLPVLVNFHEYHTELQSSSSASFHFYSSRLPKSITAPTIIEKIKRMLLA